MGMCFFNLPHVEVEVPNAYGKAMDEMDKIYDGHALCRMKQPTFEMSLVLHPRGLDVLVICNAQQ